MEKELWELKAYKPILYLPLKKGETQEEAIKRMINLLESVGIDHLQGSIAEENTEIQNAYE